MAEMKYLDFDLLIERAGERYKVQASSPTAGQAFGEFNLPFSELEIENFLLRVGRPRRSVRRVDSPEMVAVKNFGSRLFDAVFDDEVRACLRSSLEEAERQGAGLRLRLRLTKAPELTDLPWEYLYNRPLNCFLSLAKETPIVRYLGGFDQQAKDGVLMLEDDEGRGRPVSGQYLGTLLHNHRPLRLALLNACEGGRASRSDPFAGTAQSLMQQGLPAVIAMQFEITDAAAIAFTREFYAAVADGEPIDAAMVEARAAIFAQGDNIEWGTPVLYMRAPDGRIFDIERISHEERRKAKLAVLNREEESRRESVSAHAKAPKRIPVHKLVSIGSYSGGDYSWPSLDSQAHPKTSCTFATSLFVH
ncbi:CHAT domain-containing protein [candidate division KSB1 bacterium]|nr:CHAT domain-containing protein [candidate division KSB1 bacterium]